MTTNFGFAPGILEYWILLSDWRNGSFAILMALSVLFVGYVKEPTPSSEAYSRREFVSALLHRSQKTCE